MYAITITNNMFPCIHVFRKHLELTRADPGGVERVISHPHFELTYMLLHGSVKDFNNTILQLGKRLREKMSGH